MSDFLSITAKPREPLVLILPSGVTLEEAAKALGSEPDDWELDRVAGTLREYRRRTQPQMNIATRG